jgi:hypothetical protein
MALYGGYMDFQNNNFGFGNLTPGRAWGFDCIVNGAYATQQSALGGFHAVLNNYYAGPPLDNTSGNFWAVTSPGFTLGEITNVGLLNYPIVSGFGVLGFGSGPTTLGFMTGIQVGGRGSNWGIVRSHLTIGADISDYGGIGVYIHRKYSGINYASLATAGTNYTSNPKVTWPTPTSGYPAKGTGLLSPTTVTGLTLVSGGNGYVTAPTVTIDPPFPSGTQATAQAVINNQGQVTGFMNITPGSNYNTVPNVTLSGGGGGGATATATIGGTSVAGVAIDDPGLNYTSTPGTAVFTGGGAGSGASASATMQGSGVEAIVLTYGGFGYLGKHPPQVTIAAPPSGVTATAVAAVDPTGAVAAIMITNPGNGYLSAPSVSIAAPTPITAQATATVGGGYVTGINVTESGGYYSTPPQVTIGSPPMGGVQATAVANLFAGRVASVTIINPGFGYTSPPAVSFTAPIVAVNNAQGKAILGGVAIAVDADAGPIVLGGVVPFGAELTVSTNAATNKGVVLRAAASQTANLQEWQDTSGNILGSIGPAGAWTGSVDLLSGPGPIVLDVTKGTLHTLTLSAPITINSSAAGNVAQELTVLLMNTSGSAQNVTFGSLFKTAGSATVAMPANSAATLRFVSNGTSWYEVCRATNVSL